MDDELTPEQKFAAEDPETMVPRALVQGRAPEDIIAELVRLGWSPRAAQTMVFRVGDDLRRFHESPESRERLLKEAKTQLFVGLILTLLGAGVTAFTLIRSVRLSGAFAVLRRGVWAHFRRTDSGGAGLGAMAFVQEECPPLRAL